MKNTLIRWLSVLGIFFTPAYAYAQSSTGAIGIIDRVQFIMNTRVVPIIIGIALIYFLLGVLEYIRKPDGIISETARSRMVYGLIGLFVMISVWGLVNLVGDTFGIQSGGQAPILPIVNPNKQGI
ncbi:MAG: hypothetical protein V4674_03955 [Patescibacteria group bacterium]